MLEQLDTKVSKTRSGMKKAMKQINNLMDNKTNRASMIIIAFLVFILVLLLVVVIIV
jgi:hypothetical protein